MRFFAPLCLLALAACMPQPQVMLTPEAAFPKCEQAALPELKRLDPATSAAKLDPLVGAKVERRTLPPKADEGVSLILAGRGSSTAGPSAGSFRYTCLIGSRGGVLYVGLQPDATSEVLAECPGREASCLRDLGRRAEADLALAEAEAVRAARARDGKRAEIDEPAATSIGAWRVYRDADCERRFGRGDTELAACRIELTRRRVRELRG